MEISVPDTIINVEWLYSNLSLPQLVILDATIPKVGASEGAASEHQIPNAVFFDIKHSFSLPNAPFPNTVPTAEQFEKEARKIGINKDSLIVVYDEKGMYSSPRAWYMFKAFGHDNIAILDGGLPEWSKRGYPLEVKYKVEKSEGNFEARYRPNFFVTLEELQKTQGSEGKIILDARSSERFKGEVPEPRKGLRSGTIPSSKNLPFIDLSKEGLLKSKEELKEIFDSVSNKDDELILSCGSGITACVLALGAYVADRENISVYDGSWTEYGSLIDAQIEK
ncbi:sulfurtransferase [Maribacter cobaltidurans]|uniref:Uncharacterized protein n=1 Tax=Maribacter cobaltidurans TaxID=1178778 RepID=A0A223V9S2_9FLAO|nr:sulfurtransferase [Maribacter cobaltidurans]ASV32052.1 hypothetical protein CJ263_18530 [Maribacter cobaltidurans]GGD86761.1 sulfurtransferase [Maribacter cobaltidurans]